VHPARRRLLEAAPAALQSLLIGAVQAWPHSRSRRAFGPRGALRMVTIILVELLLLIRRI